MWSVRTWLFNLTMEWPPHGMYVTFLEVFALLGMLNIDLKLELKDMKTWNIYGKKINKWKSFMQPFLQICSNNLAFSYPLGGLRMLDC